MDGHDADTGRENGQTDQHLVLAEESPFSHIDHPKKRAFLAAYRETCHVRLAADMAETSRSSVYRWRDQDPEFEEAFELATESESVAVAPIGRFSSSVTRGARYRGRRGGVAPLVST